MRVAVTGATGLLGTRLVQALKARGDSVVVVSRAPERAGGELGVDAVEWESLSLSGIDGVVNLAGEPVAQRWSDAARERIRTSRTQATARLIEKLGAAHSRPGVLVSASASGYYGDRGAHELDESEPAGDDFLASVCLEWERGADSARDLGVRVVKVRTGVVLDGAGGALRKMLPPFKAGVGGPVAGGRQYMPWIALGDVVGIYLAALSEPGWSGPVNACAPGAVTNAEFSRALGRVLHRPAVVPIPGLALRLLYGEMASIVTASQRMVPSRTLSLGYEFAHAELGAALEAALS